MSSHGAPRDYEELQKLRQHMQLLGQCSKLQGTSLYTDQTLVREENTYFSSKEVTVVRWRQLPLSFLGPDLPGPVPASQLPLLEWALLARKGLGTRSSS